MKKLVEWKVDTHLQLPDSAVIRKRVVGDQDLLAEDLAEAYRVCGFVDVVGDAADVPAVEKGDAKIQDEIYEKIVEEVTKWQS